MPSLDIVFDALDRCEISASEFIIALITGQHYQNHRHQHDLVRHCSNVFRAFLHHLDTHNKLVELSVNIVKETYHQELCVLASEANGWHFGASSATTKQMEDFSLKEMARNIESNAPQWWELLGLFLDDEKTRPEGQSHGDQMRDVEMDDADHDYWSDVDEIDLEGIISGLAEETSTRLSSKERRERRRLASMMMKKTVVSGIIVHGINQKANMLQSLLGFFMQSAHTPQKVVDTFARVGISISTDAINLAVRSLSTESQNALQDLGQSLLASYAYDNFDVDLKSEVTSVEKSNESLKHLTSGLLFPIAHGVAVEDLRCSEELWEKSPLNPKHHPPPKHTWHDLINLHPDPKPSDSSSLSQHDEFNSWMFLRDLCTHGPEYFHQFRARIPDPKSIEQIPTVKTPIFAARAMDVNNSTVSGNIQAVNDLLEQGGITDPSTQSDTETNLHDISQYVVLVHGDLGTGERLQTAQLRRSIESTSWDRMQHVLFIPGLFHLKMACADALWRCFLHPPAAREDETSLMRDVAQLRPKETGIYGSKPNFRRMHQLIDHAGICRRLDCWRVHAMKKKPNITSLADFVSSEPLFEDLKEMADEIAHTYVQVASHRLHRTRRKPSKERDVQFENALLLNKYFLLYEELSYAMNCGDIGRVETCIISWIPILKAIGKHKYATHMTNFLLNLHFVYPAGLRQAVRYHILVNPTGQSMKWRAVDWCVELNNLFTKVKNGGKGSNRTVERIILESPLIQVYRNVQALVAGNFDLTHTTRNHAAPNMKKTFQSIQERLALNSPHVVSLGRKSRREIEDLKEKGHEMIEKAEQGETVIDEEPENEGNGNDVHAVMEDIIVELL